MSLSDRRSHREMQGKGWEKGSASGGKEDVSPSFQIFWLRPFTAHGEITYAEGACCCSPPNFILTSASRHSCWARHHTFNRIWNTVGSHSHSRRRSRFFLAQDSELITCSFTSNFIQPESVHRVTTAEPEITKITVFWATVCKTVHPMLSGRCLSVMSVCLSVLSCL